MKSIPTREGLKPSSKIVKSSAVPAKAKGSCADGDSRKDSNASTDCHLDENKEADEEKLQNNDALLL